MPFTLGGLTLGRLTLVAVFSSRTLTAVHDAILEDLVFPSEIVGKRIRVKLDGSRLIKVHLDKAQQNNVEHKVAASLARAGPVSGEGGVRRSSVCPGPGALPSNLGPLPMGYVPGFPLGGIFSD